MLNRMEFQDSVEVPNSYSGWPLRIVENVLKVSNKNSCSTSECRSHDESKDLVFCKVAKLAKMIDIKYLLIYSYTEFKAKAKGETSKFIFTISKKENKNKPSQDNNIKRISTIRVCVPVDSSKDVWIDANCPYDSCEQEYQKECFVLPSNEEKISDANIGANDEKIHQIIENKLLKVGSTITN